MSDRPLDTELIDINGFVVQVAYYDDYDSEPPWEDDGHGPVRYEDSATGKRPGERIMRTGDGRGRYLYDWQAACKLARKDKWGPGKPHEAAQADMDFLAGFTRGDWGWAGVKVMLELYPQYEDSLWRVESYKNYHVTCAEELAQELVNRYLDDIEKGVLLWDSET